jgi:15-cis-phytoene synthase
MIWCLMQPLLPDLSLASPADLALCRQMIRQGSRSFHLASLLLPERYREPARALYGFCRMADDAVDNSADPQKAVTRLMTRLDRIYDHQPEDAATDRAFADVVHHFAIPRALPDALIEGFAWDATGRRYITLADVTAYAVRVAGTVGMMMSLIMGCRSTQGLARAVDLGIAMQFSNIARDVEEDARNGRIYLPQSWQSKSNTASDMASRLVDEAEVFYARAKTGVVLLPRSCRASIHAARLLYREIGHQAARQDHKGRAIVPGSRKAVLMLKAFPAAMSRANASRAPVVPEAAFLIDAVLDGRIPHRHPKTMTERALWVMELFKALESRNQRGPS